ncbi:MAG: coproporphyrinogen III oxidase family protein [Acidimicrobiales bacterium]|nr:coproporphyrinogen III oxidase family protein [Acidimicrobiales bacterium]
MAATSPPPAEHAPPVEHLYVHVPFCPTICPFCSFHVLRRRDDLVAAYLRRLDDELAALADAWPDTPPLRSVYLGGGTPTHLADGELDRLLGSIRRRFVLDQHTEIGIEAHPLTITAGRPPRWRELGFTRVSVGVQSTQDEVLRALGRRHDAATALAGLDAVLAVEGWSVNADLIVAAPGQHVETDLRAVAARGVHHLSAYTLTIEPGTPFERRGVTVDEEAERAALRAAGEILPAYGLHRYEVSNHARVGHRCTHNLGYWRGAYWFGVGPSATASLPPSDPHADPLGRRLRRNPDLDRWLVGEPPADECLDAGEVARVGLLTGLRLSEGVERGMLERVAPARGASGDAADERLATLVRDGLLRLDGSRVYATEEGLVVLDRVVAALW